MPDSCCAVGCTNRRTKDSPIPFYRIPRSRTSIESKRREEWIKAINRPDWTDSSDRQISNSRICGAHFVTGKKSENPTDPNWIPTIFNPHKGRKYRGKQVNHFHLDVAKDIQQEMATNYQPKQEGNQPSVQLAFNPVPHAVPQQSGSHGAHYSTPVQVARPPQPPPPPPQSEAKHRPQVPVPPAHGHVSYQTKYGELLNVIEDLGREIKPTYAGSKMAQERLKKGIMHARALVRECLAEVEKSARQ